MDIETLFEKFQEHITIIRDRPGHWVSWENVRVIFDELKEAEVVKIPQEIADWIECCKKINYTLYKSMNPFANCGLNGLEEFSGNIEEVLKWIRHNSETYARAWTEGYEVEKEERYLVKLKATNQYLHVDNFSKASFLPLSISSFGTEVTKTMLDNLGLSEVFSNPLFEVEEVK